MSAKYADVISFRETAAALLYVHRRRSIAWGSVCLFRYRRLLF
jgi:hypothetical protein